MISTTTWSSWREHFERNQTRPLPTLSAADVAALTPSARAWLAWSLARFQLGETGEGRIARRIYDVCLPGIDDDYRRALGLFIREEGRHARILGTLVHALGGRLITRTWTRHLFIGARRLGGVRGKLLVLHAAEVIGIGFYGALASGLAAGQLRAALEQIRDDETAHLRFHRDFFATQAPSGWRRGLFVALWALVATSSALVVLWDHRRTLRALSVPQRRVAGRLAALIVEGGRRAGRAAPRAAALAEAAA
jgi:hypothetical protein